MAFTSLQSNALDKTLLQCSEDLAT